MESIDPKRNLITIMSMVCSVWCVVCGVWCVVCGVWCVVCGVWCVVCGVCSNYELLIIIRG